MDQALLVGRTQALAELDALLEEARLGEPAIALLEGEAGMGKTRLLDELDRRASDAGAIVLRGGAPPPTGQPLPYAAISQLLRDILRKLPEAERTALVAATPELGILHPSWQVPGSPVPVTSLTALCERLLDVVEAVADGRPFAVILLDDLHWADAGTLDFVTYLARSPREAPVVVVLATRDDDADPHAPMRQARASILRGRVRRVALGPLEDGEVETLLDAIEGDGTLDRRQVRERGAGNPLYLTELASAATRGSSDVPEGLVALVGDRVAALPPAEQQVLRVLCTVCDGVPAEQLVRILDAPEDAVFEAVRGLVAHGLVAASDDGILVVTQPLVREVVADGVLPAERRRIHAAAARAMVADPGSDPRPEVQRLVRLAEHWDAAGDRLRAMPALIRAAAACEQVFAFTTAYALYGRALGDGPAAAETDSQDGRRLGFRSPMADATSSGTVAASVDPGLVDLRRRAVDAAVLAGHPDVGLGWSDEGLAAMPAGPDRGPLELARARALLASGQARAAVEAFEAALALQQPPTTAALTGLTRARVAAGEPGSAVTTGEDAVRAARAGHSAVEEVAALLALGTALAADGRVAEGVERIQEARALRDARSTPSIVTPRMSRVIDLSGGLAEAARAIRSGGSSDAASLAQDAATTAARFGAEADAARLRLDEVAADVQAGRWDAAIPVLGELAGHSATRVAALALRARVAALRGAWDAAAADLARVEGASLVRARPADRATFATASVELRVGRRETEAAIGAAVEGLVLTREAPDAERAAFAAVACRAVVDSLLAARALRAKAEEDERSAMVAALLEHAGDPSAGDPPTRALRWTAAAELGRGSAGGAAPDWSAVRAAWDAIGAPWWSAYAGYREAETVLTASRARDAARDSLVRSRDLAEGLEAAPLLADIAALAARSRLELRAAPPAPVRAERKLPISDRELEVLVLLARGLTNKEIAAELFISEKTAAHHVEHIFTKLDVTSRVEAAGVAHQAGIVG